MNFNLLSYTVAFTIPALIVFVTAYYIINKMMQTQIALAELKIKQNLKNTTIPIQLQAYERLALLMERIDLFSMVQRLRTPNMLVAELQLSLAQQIRIEFEHNMSQQVYVSPEIWNMVRGTKEEMLMIVNNIGARLPPSLPAKEFTRALMEYLNELDGVLPTIKTLEAIKQEVKKVL